MARPPANQASPPDFESEVRANILAQPLSPSHDLGTIADLDLPHDFLTRLADRVLRASFYERFRAIVGDAPAAAPTIPAPAPAPPAQSDSTSVRIEHLALAAADAALWAFLPESPPELASFRSPLTDDLASAQRHLAPETTLADTLRAARRVARKHLARAGLLPALAHTIAAIGPARLLPPHTDVLSLVGDAGIPVDLLAFIRPAFAPAAATPADIVGALASRLASGEPLDKLLKSLRKPCFAPRASLLDFRPTSDSGLDRITLLRAHATRATHYSAPGDGSNLDLLSGVLAALPGTRAIVSTSNAHACSLKIVLEQLPRSSPVTIFAQPLVVSQWAGDNAKPGTLGGKPAHLAPRFVSRCEYHPVFVPGDDFAICAAAPHIRTARSPLLFQGGNLLVVDDLPNRRRVLLIGEAEVQRNRALGLSAAEALAFLQLEFGADDAEVLPACSYHIDQELTIRSTPERTIVFVPHALAGAVGIVECVLVALADCSRWPVELVENALGELRALRIHEFLTLIWTVLPRERTPEHAWPVAFADALSTGSADSGVGNLQRFLLALDHIAAEAVAPAAFPDAILIALHRSLHRRAADRAKIRTILSRRGWSIVPVPALPEESRGINPLNGVHTPEDYLMPAYGGLFASLDEVAANAFRSALGPGVRVIPIFSAESQRREGALHCSVALYGQ